MHSPSLDESFEIISSIANKISFSMTNEQLASNVQNFLEHFMKVEYNGLYFYDEKSKILKLIYAKNFSEKEKIEAEKSAMDRHPGLVYKTKKHLLINDTTKSKDSSSSERSFKILSRLYIPLLIENKCVGTFGLASSTKDKFSEYDIKILSLVGAMVAMRIITINKELKNKEQHQANLQLTKNLNIINTFANVIHKGESVDDVVWSVAKSVIAELGYTDCVIYILDEAGEYLIQRAAHGNKNPDSRAILDPIKIKIGHGIVGSVAASRKGEIISDTSKDKRYILDDLSRLSEISVPIINDNQLIGVIDSEHTEKNFYPKEHLELLNTVASITATKLMQVKYNDELKKHHLELENLVKIRTNELEQKSIKIENQNVKLKMLSLFPKHNPNPVIELDFNLKVQYSNEGAKKHFSNTPLLNNNHDNPLTDKYRKLLEKTIFGKKTGVYIIPEGFRINNKHYDFNLYIDNEFKILRLYLNDVTEIKNMQAQLKEQHDSIYDSLNYALRIQKSILPDLSIFEGFYNDNFIFYKPKDVVSGDFYWSKKFDTKLLFCLCDCTGHGVPGALMSIIGHDALNNIIKYIKVSNIGDILTSLNSYFYDFQKNNENDLRIGDTMDVTLICYDKKTNAIKYTGCKHQFYLIRNNELQTYRTDTHTLGSKIENVSFDFKEIKVQKGDVFYLFSDGFPDQFGGELGKKFKYRRFRELLLSIHHLPMKEQKIKLKDSLENWQNSQDQYYEQIDDISIVGLKI